MPYTPDELEQAREWFEQRRQNLQPTSYYTDQEYAELLGLGWTRAQLSEASRHGVDAAALRRGSRYRLSNGSLSLFEVREYMTAVERSNGPSPSMVSALDSPRPYTEEETAQLLSYGYTPALLAEADRCGIPASLLMERDLVGFEAPRQPYTDRGIVGFTRLFPNQDVTVAILQERLEETEVELERYRSAFFDTAASSLVDELLSHLTLPACDRIGLEILLIGAIAAIMLDAVGTGEEAHPQDTVEAISDHALWIVHPEGPQPLVFTPSIPFSEFDLDPATETGLLASQLVYQWFYLDVVAGAVVVNVENPTPLAPTHSERTSFTQPTTYFSDQEVAELERLGWREHQLRLASMTGVSFDALRQAAGTSVMEALTMMIQGRSMFSTLGVPAKVSAPTLFERLADDDEQG